MKVAIVGAEEQTRHLAPYGNPEYDIWVFNEFANAPWCKRWDLCFQLHSPKVYRGPNEKDPHHWEWLQQRHGKPVVMQAFDPLVPDSVAYPIAQVNRRFMSNLSYKGERQSNFRATVSYALALAALKYDEIHVYGVELAYSAEYRSQQNNFAFWVGAVSQHAKIVLHCCKGMFDKPLYGFEEYMQEDKIQRYIEGLNQQLEEARRKVAMLEGALMLATQMLTEEKESRDVKEA